MNIHEGKVKMKFMKRASAGIIISYEITTSVRLFNHMTILTRKFKDYISNDKGSIMT